MTQIQALLPYIQIILSVIMVALILMQHSDAGAGAAFGGGDMSSGIHSRRGAEKVIFITTIVVAVLFTASAFLALIIK